MTVDEFSSATVWYSFVQTEHCHWAEQEWPLFDESERTKQAAVDQQKKQNLTSMSVRVKATT